MAADYLSRVAEIIASIQRTQKDKIDSAADDQRKHDPSTANLLLSLAESVGVTPEVQVSGSGTSEVEVRRLVSSDARFVFVFNHGDGIAETNVSMNLPWKAKTALDLVSNQDVTLQFDGNATVLRKTLDAGGIWVVRLQAQ